MSSDVVIAFVERWLKRIIGIILIFVGLGSIFTGSAPVMKQPSWSGPAAKLTRPIDVYLASGIYCTVGIGMLYFSRRPKKSELSQKDETSSHAKKTKLKKRLK